MRKKRIDPRAVVAAVVYDRLLKIEDHVSVLRSMMLDHVAADIQRHKEILAALGPWIDPALDLEGLMAQLASIGRDNIRVTGDLAAQLRREMALTRSAIAAATGTLELEATADTSVVEAKRPPNGR
jgi:hypothetical protein